VPAPAPAVVLPTVEPTAGQEAAFAPATATNSSHDKAPASARVVTMPAGAGGHAGVRVAYPPLASPSRTASGARVARRMASGGRVAFAPAAASSERGQHSAGSAATAQEPTSVDLLEFDMESLRQDQDDMTRLYVERRAAVLRGDSTTVPLKQFARLMNPNSNQSEEEANQMVLKTLCHAAMAMAVYTLVSVVLFTAAEGWGLLECCYFAVVTVTTVGYGDLTPSTPAGKMLAMVLSWGGLVAVMALVNQLVSVIVSERKRRALSETIRALDEASSKLRDGLQSEAAVTAAATLLQAVWRGMHTRQRLGVHGGAAVGVAGELRSGGCRAIKYGRAEHMAAESAAWRLCDGILGLAAMQPEECARSAWRTLSLAPRRVASWVSHTMRSAYQLGQLLLWTLKTMQPLLAAVGAIAASVGMCEGWSALDSVYFAWISLLTVGYGDLIPASTTGHLLLTLLLPIGCAVALSTINALSERVIDALSERRGRLQLDYGSGLDDQVTRMEKLLRHTSGKEGMITEVDFMCSTLIELDLVDAEVLSKVREQFYQLDKRAAGFLSMESYLRMVTVLKGGARERWQHAASMAMQERRVLHALTVSFKQRSFKSPESSPSNRDKSLTVLEMT